MLGRLYEFKQSLIQYLVLRKRTGYRFLDMQVWLIAAFIGPLTGFLLGIAITFYIFKRSASVRNLFFDSLVCAVLQWKKAS